MQVKADGKRVTGMTMAMTMAKTKKKRFLAAAAVLLLALFMLLSLCFLVAESGHDCIGEDCPICCQISLCKELVKAVCHGFTAAFAVAVIGLSVLCIPSGVRETNVGASLVARKVKLSD